MFAWTGPKCFLYWCYLCKDDGMLRGVWRWGPLQWVWIGRFPYLCDRMLGCEMCLCMMDELSSGTVRPGRCSCGCGDYWCSKGGTRLAHHIRTMTSQFISAMTSQLIGAMTSQFISAMTSQLASIMTSQLRTMTLQQVKAMTSQSVETIASRQWRHNTSGWRQCSIRRRLCWTQRVDVFPLGTRPEDHDKVPISLHTSLFPIDLSWELHLLCWRWGWFVFIVLGNIHNGYRYHSTIYLITYEPISL